MTVVFPISYFVVLEHKSRTAIWCKGSRENEKHLSNFEANNLILTKANKKKSDESVGTILVSRKGEGKQTLFLFLA